MRIGTKPRAARAVLALLVGLVAGGWVGGGLMYVFNRTKHHEAAGEVAPVSLPAADEFALVPADAAGFVHVRAADLWKTDAMSAYRGYVGKAGADALKALDDGFVPAPSTLDRATLVALARPGAAAPPPLFVPPGKGKGALVPPPPRDNPPEVDAVFVLTFNAAIDPVKVREAYLPKGQKQVVGDHEVWSEAGGTGVAFHGDRTLVVGGEAAVRALLNHKKTPEGPLAPALKLAAGGTRHVVGAMNLKAYRPTEFTRTLPPETSPLLRADALAAGVVVGRGMRVDLRAAYRDADDAEAAEKELRKSAEAGRKSLADAKKKMQEAVAGKPDAAKPRPPGELPEAVGGLFALGALTMLDEWLADPKLERAGPELSAAVTIDSVAGAYGTVAAVGAGLLMPAVQKVREAAGRAQEQNNLKQIGLALHSHHDVTGRLPSAAISNPPNAPRGRPLLSWRVAILPYLGEQALYDEFRMNEPWDSPHNSKLVPRMPRVFATPGGQVLPGMTHYRVFTTPETARVKTMFGRTVGRRITDTTDGTSNTIMVVEAADAVEWTKPDDLAFDADDDPPPLGLRGGAAGFSALLGDGSVRYFAPGTRPEALRVWIGANDGIPNPRE